MEKVYVLSKLLHHSRIYCTLFKLMIFCCCSTLAEQVYYPPFTNLAYEKPVELSPANTICGLNQASEFCESRTQQQNLCDKLVCHVSCEDGSETSLPYSKALFVAFSDTLPKACGIQRSNFRAPDTSIDSFQFLSSNSSDPCFLSLIKSQMIDLQLQSMWSVTLTFYIWNDLDDSQEGWV